MKKLLLSLCFTAFSTITFAQSHDNSDNQITFGIVGGLSDAWFNVKALDQPDVYTIAQSVFSIGFNADIKISDNLSVRPGIIYQGMGSIVNVAATYDVYETYKLHYFEIPVDLIGHWYVGQQGANIFYGGGPFLSLGLNGSNYKTVGSPDSAENIKFGSNGDFKSVDYGATTVLGFQTRRGMSIGGNWEFGLLNILQKSDLNIAATSAKTGVFYLSIGQTF